MTSMKITQCSRPPLHPPCLPTSKILPPLDLGRPISNKPFQMITNQLKVNIIQGWLLYVIRSGLSFRSAFVFNINSLIFSGFRLTFFAFIWSKSRQSWTEPALCTFSWHYILVCEVVQKYHEMLFLKKFFLVLILHSTCFIFITSKGKQTTEKQLHRAWEWTKSNKKKSRHIQIDPALKCSI